MEISKTEEYRLTSLGRFMLRELEMEAVNDRLLEGAMELLRKRRESEVPSQPPGGRLSPNFWECRVGKHSP